MKLRIFADSSDRPLEAIESVAKLYREWRDSYPGIEIQAIDTTAASGEGVYIFTLTVGYKESA